MTVEKVGGREVGEQREEVEGNHGPSGQCCLSYSGKGERKVQEGRVTGLEC